MTKENAISEITQERERQNKMWGIQSHDQYMWLAILSEEIGELAEAMLDYSNDAQTRGIELGAARHKELVQCAAVCLQMLEAGL